MNSVSDIMHRKFAYFDAKDTVGKAAGTLHDQKLPEAPLIVQGKFAGAIRARKIAGLLVRGGIFTPPKMRDPKLLGKMPVAAVADKFVRTLSPKDSIAKAMALFSATGFDALYVLDSKRKIIGVVYEYDLMEESSKLFWGKRAEKPKFISPSGGQATMIDDVLRFIRKMGVVDLSAISKEFNITENEVEDYAQVLSKSGFIKVEYDMFGRAKYKGAEQ